MVTRYEEAGVNGMLPSSAIAGCGWCFGVLVLFGESEVGEALFISIAATP